jgi:hypothetical protein
MGIDVSLKQKGLFKKTIDFSLVETIANDLSLTIATSDQYFRIKDYDKEQALAETTLLLYDSQLLSRGFTLSIDENYYDCELRQTYYCNDNDIRKFFSFTKALAQKLKISSYEKDGELLPLSDIPTRIEKEIAFNRQTLVTQFKEDNYPDMIFAVMNPISVEPTAAEALLQMSEDQAMEYWNRYLHDKQVVDYFYSAPFFYRTKEESTIARYSLTENVLTVLPKEPFVPFGFDIDQKDVQDFKIALVSDKGDGVLAQIEFEQLWKFFPLEKQKPYDQRCVYVEVTSDDMLALLNTL